GRRDEQLALGTREIFIHYGAGMADSRLRVPYAPARHPPRNMKHNRQACSVVALFIDGSLPGDPLDGVTGRRDEQLALGTREIFIHYGAGMADSRLRVPYA
ncbi:hypothetical protein C7E12_19505, partial [Stenotrophomonas maltophilia]